jgi:hypothetical protein
VGWWAKRNWLPLPTCARRVAGVGDDTGGDDAAVVMHDRRRRPLDELNCDDRDRGVDTAARIIVARRATKRSAISAAHCQ